MTGIPVEGFMYPNEIELQWSVLIVLYPFLTGLVAGAFILASLERVFRVDAVKPTYRLALLTALAFLLVAPLPLQLHLGHPERSLEMYLTPHTSSAMAMFGFVYLWYLMAVLVLEVWLDYRHDIVVLSQTTTGWKRWLYKIMTLGSTNISPRALGARPEGRMDHHHHRHSLGVSAARLRGLHLRQRESQSLVVVATDAGRISLFRNGLGHRHRHAGLHVSVPGAQRADRHALPRHRSEVPVLRLSYRLHARTARPDSPHLRVGRIVPQPRLHGAHQALLAAYRDSDFAGHA